MTDLSVKPGQAIKPVCFYRSRPLLCRQPLRGSPAILRRLEHERQKLPGRSSRPAGPPHTRATRGAAAVPGGPDPPGGTHPVHRSAETLRCSCLRCRLSEITHSFPVHYPLQEWGGGFTQLLGDLTDKLKFHFGMLGCSRLASVPVE